MTGDFKRIEVRGTSQKNWEDATQNAVDEARKISRHLNRLEILEMSATIGGMGGKIMEYMVRILVNPVGD